VDYLNVKVGGSKELNGKIRISEHNGKALALYNSNKGTIHNLQSNSMVDVKYNSSTQKFDIYDWGGKFLVSMTAGSGNFIGASNTNNSIVKANNKSYRGFIYFVTNNNRIDVVNHVSIQDYLYGVIPREMPTWNTPIESLKAQAVTARSYAVINRNKHFSLGYGLCDTVDCQAYGGYDGEEANANKAVDETKDKVVTYNDNIVATYFHANSGGHTEDAGEVWSTTRPYLVGVKDPYSENTIGSTWNIPFLIRIWRVN